MRREEFEDYLEAIARDDVRDDRKASTAYHAAIQHARRLGLDVPSVIDVVDAQFFPGKGVASEEHR